MKISGIRAVLAIIMAIGLWGCSSPGASLPPIKPTNPGAYTLDSGDKLRIIIFGEDRLSDDYAVDGNGTISIPLLDAISARGKTTDQLEQSIIAELKKGIVLDPSVNVQVQSFRPFFILGEISSPGQYAFVEGMTTLTAVAIGGGFTFRAKQDIFSITRVQDDKSVEGRGGRNTVVEPGDVVFVFERFF